MWGGTAEHRRDQSGCRDLVGGFALLGTCEKLCGERRNSGFDALFNSDAIAASCDVVSLLRNLIDCLDAVAKFYESTVCNPCGMSDVFVADTQSAPSPATSTDWCAVMSMPGRFTWAAPRKIRTRASMMSGHLVGVWSPKSAISRSVSKRPEIVEGLTQLVFHLISGRSGI